jgi:hypothetical protein
MRTQYIVREFLDSVRKFNQAMDGLSGDLEVDAACTMRDSAMAIARELSERDTQVGELLAAFDSEELVDA